jgi:hypothetical protein
VVSSFIGIGRAETVKAKRAVALLALAVACSSAQGQTAANATTPSATPREDVPWFTRWRNAPPYELAPGEDPQNSIRNLPKHLAMDQLHFWTAPTRAEKKDLRWIIPASAGLAGLIASDAWVSRQVPDKPNQLNQSLNISNYLAYGMVGAAGGSFLLGQMTHNDHLRETGLLSGESALDATAATYAFKLITQRPRPQQDNGNGTFFTGGYSFTSEHSALAWAIASTAAHEYPGWLTSLLAYGAASTVTLTRVTAKQHFDSDALVGAALGWWFGREVYRAHHDSTLGGAPWGPLLEHKSDEPRNPDSMGSPYLAMDSWVYPQLDRLIALGYIRSAMLGIRPWTRLQIARMVDEAGEKLSYNADDKSEAGQIYRTLLPEFQPEMSSLEGEANVGASVDSVYVRTGGISGPPLRDAYHFAQTEINDYGRPYGEGFNAIAGFTSHAVAGPLAFDVQAEYQHAPPTPSYPFNVQQAIANADITEPLANGNGTINRLTLLSGAASFTFHGTQISFGKQNLYLGPTEEGPFLYSTNSAPIPMLRIDTINPFKIPLLSHVLGPARTEFILGQLSGAEWLNYVFVLHGPPISPQPWIHGEKVAFKPTDNFEFGLGVTTLFAGGPIPFTWHNFFHSFYQNNAPNTPRNISDQRSTFDFNWRVPKLRNWLTIYGDSLVEDEVSPLGSTRPSAQLGIFMPKVPKIPKLQIRAEGGYTDVPGQKAFGFIYYNNVYRSGYTVDGYLIGNWLGRQGRGGLGTATYWFSPRNSIQFAYRAQRVDPVFLEGGSLNDFALNWTQMLGANFGLTANAQYETWHFPLLAANKTTNFSTFVQFTYWPHWRVK